MEIFKILFSIIAFTIFRALTWLQFGALLLMFNTVYYFYGNKDDIKKNIKELNSELGLKNGLLIIGYGLPLILIDLTLYLIEFFKNIWLYFIKTTIGNQFYKFLKMIDNYIINKKNEMKNKIISMIMSNAMSGFGNSKSNSMNGFGNSNSSMPFGNMPDINDLLKNPGQMNDIMKNVNNLMSNMNNNNKKIIPQLNSSSASTSEINIDNKPMMDDDLFNKINNYIENENVDVDVDDDKKLFKKTMWETKKINNKLKKRNKNKKKVSTDEFNDVKNMTIALEDVLKQLKNN